MEYSDIQEKLKSIIKSNFFSRLFYWSQITLKLGELSNIIESLIIKNSQTSNETELLNKKIRDSNLPEDIRIGAIVRKDQVIIPRSNFVFEKDDLVVFLAKREQLKEVESIFSVSSI